MSNAADLITTDYVSRFGLLTCSVASGIAEFPERRPWPWVVLVFLGEVRVERRRVVKLLAGQAIDRVIYGCIATGSVNAVPRCRVVVRHVSPIR